MVILFGFHMLLFHFVEKFTLKRTIERFIDFGSRDSNLDLITQTVFKSLILLVLAKKKIIYKHNTQGNIVLMRFG